MDRSIIRQWSMRAEAHLPGIDVELIDCRWASGFRAAVEDGHIISLSVSPAPPNARARLVGGSRELDPLGMIYFMPSGIELDADSSGGPHRILRCRISEDAFRESTGHQGTGWSRKQLIDSIDLGDLHLRGTLRRLASEVLDPGFASGAVIETLTRMVALDALRGLGGPQRRTADGSLSSRDVRKIEDRILDLSLALPTVSEIATLLGIGSRHLLRGYRAAAGSTLRSRLQQASVARAAGLLVTTDLPLKVIAHRLGFRSQSSFSTSFLNATGESPRSYRYHRQ